MNIIFIDRFSRRNLVMNFSYIKYIQNISYVVSNRERLPALLCSNGSIIWRNTDITLHNIKGPAITEIDGPMKYMINGRLVTIFDVMMS